MPLMYSQPKYGLNSSSGLGCRGGVLEILDFGPSSHCNTSLSVQVSSFYKMRSHFFVRRPSIEETTGPNWPKFCMGHPRVVTRGFIEGFLEIRSGDPDLGYLGSPRGGPKILKFFCLDFFIFLDGNVYLKVYIAHHSENKSFIRPFLVIWVF